MLTWPCLDTHAPLAIDKVVLEAEVQLSKAREQADISCTLDSCLRHLLHSFFSRGGPWPKTCTQRSLDSDAWITLFCMVRLPDTGLCLTCALHGLALAMGWCLSSELRVMLPTCERHVFGFILVCMLRLERILQQEQGCRTDCAHVAYAMRDMTGMHRIQRWRQHQACKIAQYFYPARCRSAYEHWQYLE